MSFCVQRLHLIWLGSIPPNTKQKPYRRYIIDWAEQNPTWEIYLWTDRQGREREQIHQWCTENDIFPRFITEGDVLWGEERELVLNQLREKFYANASDLLRLRILYQMGGLYVDTDVEPTVLPQIELPLGIGLLLRKNGEELQSIAPHSIASIQGHAVLQIALWQGQSNFNVLATLEEQDFRYSKSVSERYGGVLMLTGDLLRPALKTVFGVFTADAWRWSPWLEVMQLPLSLRHLEHHSWLEEDALRPEVFFPPGLGMAIVKTWTDRALTSTLHLAAAYAESWMIDIAAQQVAPFENHFGNSPKGLAVRTQRSQDIIDCIPSI